MEAIETCSNCGKSVHILDAIEQEWFAYYWDFTTNREEGALCPTCAKQLDIKMDPVTMEYYRGDIK